MQPGKHPAQKAAEQVLKAFPETLKWFYTQRRRAGMIPACLCSAADLINHALPHDGLDGGTGLNKLSALQSILSWRVGQGIYRFDPDLYREITATALGGVIRPEAFHTMPGWGIYIETPGFGKEIQSHGFFASVSDDRHIPGYGVELRLTWLTRSGSLLALPIPLVDGTVEDCLQALRRSAMDNLQNSRAFGSPYAMMQTQMGQALGFTDEMIEGISHCLSLVLYLCSDEPDTAAPRAAPLPKPNRRGEIQPDPLKPKVWDVGLRFGAAYRAHQAAAQGRGGHPRGFARQTPAYPPRPLARLLVRFAQRRGGAGIPPALDVAAYDRQS